jgi:hypothetical protein
MLHVGINVYFWGDAEQRRLVLDGVRRWALEARAQGLSDAFWFCRFDARGPHVFALFATTAENRERLRAFLGARAEAFLRDAPSTVELGEGELRERFAQCRGKVLCAADAGSDLAPNNSFVLFDQEPHRYPLWMGAGMADPGELWRAADAVALWALERVEEGSGQRAAMRWIAAVDHALQRLAVPAEEYWRMHAATLIPALAARLETEEHEVLASLPAAVGERNGQVFTAAWSDPVPGIADHAVELVMTQSPAAQRFAVLRELNHTVLNQLGQPVRVHIPLVLHAWRCNLAPLS